MKTQHYNQNNQLTSSGVSSNHNYNYMSYGVSSSWCNGENHVWITAGGEVQNNDKCSCGFMVMVIEPCKCCGQKVSKSVPVGTQNI